MARREKPEEKKPEVEVWEGEGGTVETSEEAPAEVRENGFDKTEQKD